MNNKSRHLLHTDIKTNYFRITDAMTQTEKPKKKQKLLFFFSNPNIYEFSDPFDSKNTFKIFKPFGQDLGVYVLHQANRHCVRFILCFWQ